MMEEICGQDIQSICILCVYKMHCLCSGNQFAFASALQHTLRRPGEEMGDVLEAAVKGEAAAVGGVQLSSLRQQQFEDQLQHLQDLSTI